MSNTLAASPESARRNQASAATTLRTAGQCRSSIAGSLTHLTAPDHQQ
jgi:hypothetical protein